MVAMTPFEVDRAQLHAVNMQVLKRQDEHIIDIIGMSGHAAVYEFDQINQSWKRKDTEGSLFVVKRYTSPRFQLIVNNRLNTDNMVLTIDHSVHVDSVETFLILRIRDDTSGAPFKIYGIWFHPEEDRDKIVKILNRIIQTDLDGQSDHPTAPPVRFSTPTQEKQASHAMNGAADKKKQMKKSQQNQRIQARDGISSTQKQANKKNTTTQPKSIAILQRPQTRTNELPTQEGKAAGDIILGMISKDHATSSVSFDQTAEQNKAAFQANAATLLLPSSMAIKTNLEGTNGHKEPSKANVHASVRAISKSELKDTLIALLDEPKFLDTIHQTYLRRFGQRKSST